MTDPVRRLTGMRIDMTVRDTSGVDHDLAVMAPAGTTFDAVRKTLADVAGGCAPGWVNGRAIDPTSELGKAALVAGSICSAVPCAGDERGGRRLAVVGGPCAGKHVIVGRAAVTVGRDPECELTLPDPHVSRRHAVFQMVADRLTVSDLGSTHGTWVDGVEVETATEVGLGAMVRVGDSFLAELDTHDRPAAARPGPDGHVEITGLSPEPSLPSEHTVVLPTPPAKQRATRVQWAACLIPAVVGGTLALVMQSAVFLAFAILTPVAVIVGPLTERWRIRRADGRSEADHHRLVQRAREQLTELVRAESALRLERDPDPASLPQIPRTPTGRLWERAGDDLLRVRIGLGPAASTVLIEEDGRTRPAAIMPAVPHTVDLADGPLGVIGPRSRALALARWLVAQLATLVSPGDLELLLVVPGGHEHDWRWTRWLPHLDGRRVATTRAEVDVVVRDLAERIEGRRCEIASAGGHARQAGRRRLVLIVDGELDPLRSARIAALLADGPSLGVSALILARDAASVVAPCAVLLTPGGDAGTTVRCRKPTALDEQPVVVADQVEECWAERVARALAPLRDTRGDAVSNLPPECHLLEMMAETEPCAGSMLRRWAASDGGAGTTLGIGSDGPLRVDLARDGPHLLVAGTTGSGKSELLQTLVAGLASTHPPSVITFLLVDYKGGAAFADCAAMPHAVGLVTDLDQRMTGRVLASLHSEIRRREAMLAAAGTPDLDRFRATGGTLARLVLVVDEFATLIDELPEFVPGLVAIAQRGRSLGLHLVLATQRPAGVVSPEIRANMALRICLRVTGAGESSDVIDTRSAASIDPRTPGRGFLRTGARLLAFQTARVAACTPRKEETVRIMRLDPWRRPVQTLAAGTTGPSDLARLVEAARVAAAGSPVPHRPWLPPLPSCIELESLTDPESAAPVGNVAHVPIGLLDLPDEQRQIPLSIDVSVGGTTLVVGSARSGRSTVLRTLAVSAAFRSTPDQLHLHAIDASGSQLAALANIPHAGTISTARNGFELTARLITRLARIFQERRDHNDGHDDRPALLLLLDGWEGFVAASEAYDGARSVERMHALLADAPAAGATVVITGGRAVLAPRVAAHSATRLVLACNDAADYAAAGLDPRAAPAAIPGRGMRADGAEFQIAVTGSAVPTGRTAPGVLRLRALPMRVALDDLPTEPGRIALGSGGDSAEPVAVNLTAGHGRLLVVGPPGSGRSSAMISVLHQMLHRRPVVAAPRRSPLTTVAARHALRLVSPDEVHRTAADTLRSVDVLLVDDIEAFADSDAGNALAHWERDLPPGTVVCAAARSDALAVTFRGLGAALRHNRCGVLLQPGPVDGELLGVRLPRSRAAPTPGRGVLVPDPAWSLGGEPLPIQLAISPCADRCDRSAGRRSP